MKAKSLEKYIARFMARPEAELTTRFHAVRQEDHLPRDRGMHATELEPWQAARALLGLASERAADAAKFGSELADYVPLLGKRHSFCSAGTFLEALETILSKPDVADRVNEVVIYSHAPPVGRSVHLYWQDGEKEAVAYFIAPDNPRFDKYAKVVRGGSRDGKPAQKTFGYGISRPLIIAGAVLSELATMLQVKDADRPRSGWVGDRENL